MTSLPFFRLAFPLLLFLGHPVWSQDELNFEGLKLEFNIRRSELQKKAYDQPVSELQAKYKAVLVELQKTASQEGNLDLALAAKREAERIEDGKTIDTGKFPKIQRFQEVYKKSMEEIESAYTKRLEPLFKAYLRRLGMIELTLTQSNQLEKALLVRKEKESVIEQRKNLTGSKNKTGEDIKKTASIQIARLEGRWRRNSDGTWFEFDSKGSGVWRGQDKFKVTYDPDLDRFEVKSRNRKWPTQIISFKSGNSNILIGEGPQRSFILTRVK